MMVAWRGDRGAVVVSCIGVHVVMVIVVAIHMTMTTQTGGNKGADRDHSGGDDGGRV